MRSGLLMMNVLLLEIFAVGAVGQVRMLGETHINQIRQEAWQCLQLQPHCPVCFRTPQEYIFRAILLHQNSMATGGCHR